jgi:tetratricopeptide (TPR) repeat protein
MRHGLAVIVGVLRGVQTRASMSERIPRTTIGKTNRLDLFLRRLARSIRSNGAAFLRASPLRKDRLMAEVRKAQSFENDGKLEQSTREWQAILQSYPDARISYVGYGRLLRKLDRLADSRAILSKAIERFPRDFDVNFELALTVQRLGPLQEAIGHARGIVARYPKEPRGYVLLGRIYRDAYLFDQAEETLFAGRKASPGDIWVAREYAVTADVQNRWAIALSRWQEVREGFPDAEIGYAGLGAVLKRLKRYDEADEVLARGMARFPQDDNIGVNHAWVAEDREDWPEALRRWEGLWHRFPQNSRIETGLVECRGKARTAAAFRAVDGGHDVEAGSPIPPCQSVAAETGPLIRYADLFMRFESLGENCELGFVQRHFGAEPLGLFRWGGIPFERLLHGFSTAFEDIGRAESTELHVNPDNGEYFTTDRVLGLMTHSFINRDSATEDLVFGRLCRRLRYLRDKFLEDLAAGEKIFVFASQESLDDRAFCQLIDAMTPYGAVNLLCMRVADEMHPAGTVDLIAGGVMVGYLDRLGFDGKSRWDISFDDWRQVCQTSAARVNVRNAARASGARDENPFASEGDRS